MRKTWFVCILLALSTLSGCFYRGDGTVCDGNCLYGYGIKQWPDGSYLKGHWSWGELKGFGVQFFGTASEFAGDKYVGNFDNGYNGYGTYYGKRLDFVYKGYWLNWKTEGHGFAKFGAHATCPGWQYDGQYKEGKKSGYGVAFLGTTGPHAGITYAGNWYDDQMLGNGKYYWPDGSRYEGSFANDLFEGNGTLIFNDGAKYTGVWTHGTSASFLPVLKWHSRVAKNKDTVLMKFFGIIEVSAPRKK